MKRYRKLGILLVVFLCISAAAFGVSRYEVKQEQIKNSEDIILELAAGDVTALSWECETGSFAFHRDGTWSYDEDEAFPVDEEKIEELLGMFEEFGVSFIIEDVEDFGQYGLDDPVCTIYMETEEEAYEILLGSYSTMDSERYVSIGDGNVYLVKNDPLDSFAIEISDLIDHDEIPALEGVTLVQFSGEEEGRIVYEEDSFYTYYSGDVYFWELEENRLPLDASKVSSYLSTVTKLSLTDYVTYNASEEDLELYGLDEPELTVSVVYTAEDEEGEETTETFVLTVGLDPEEKQEAEEAEDESDVSVTAYARVGESKIIYRITSANYEKLMAMTYDSLRHSELFWADSDDITQIDISLEDAVYTITSEKEEDSDRVYYYQGEELETSGLFSSLKGITAESFTDESPSQKAEISFTIYLADENFPEVSLVLYRYDAESCIATVDGEPTAFVARADVVDLIEAVYAIVLK